VTWLLLPAPRQRNVPPTLREKLQNIDLLGAAFVMPSMVMLLMALQWGGAKFPWNSSRIIGLFVGFGITFSIFIFIEIKQGEKATIPPRILKIRTIRFCILFAVLMVAGLFGYLTYCTPSYIGLTD
jgi:Fungal trichothecene efflux pump (TRI12)